MAKQAGTTGAAAWTMASRVAAQGAQLLVFLIAARYLSPAEFGVFSLFSAINILMTRLVYAGWTEFATSWRGEAEVDAHAFTLALLGGVVATVLGCVAAAALLFFPDLAPYASLQLLLSLSLIGGGTGAYWEGALIRRKQGKALAQVILVSQVGGTIASAVGLMLGWNIIALGAGKVVTHVLYLLGLPWMVRWFPGLRLSSTDYGLAQIKEYSRSILITNLIGYTQGYAGTLILGLFLGPTAVGLYRAGTRIAASLAEILREPARIVCWMALRQAVDEVRSPEDESEASGTTAELREAERQALSTGSERFITLVLVLATPIFLGLAATSESVIVVMLGKQWQASAGVVSLLAIARWAMLPQVLTTPLFSMTKQVEQIPRLAMIAGVLTVVALPLCAPFGIEAVAMGQAVASVLGTLIAAWISAKMAGVRWVRAAFLSSASAIGSVVMVAALAAYKTWGDDPISDVRIHLVVEIVLGLLAFILPFSLLGGWRQLARAQVR